jgi:hypothetical protein
MALLVCGGRREPTLVAAELIEEPVHFQVMRLTLLALIL